MWVDEVVLVLAYEGIVYLTVKANLRSTCVKVPAIKALSSGLYSILFHRPTAHTDSG